MLFNADLNTYKSIIDTIFNQNKQYQYIYVSVGSKYNERDIVFRSSTHPVANYKNTNASYQMVPNFLQNKSLDTNVLIIIIDIFSEIVNNDFNISIMSSIITSNIDICMVSMDCCSKSFIDLCILLMTNVKTQNIPVTRFMICNYIKFMNTPNDNENNAGKTVVKTITSVLDKDIFSIYKDCFYQWYGYKYYLYNCIYKHSVSYTDLYINNTITDLNQLMRVWSGATYTHLDYNSKMKNLLENSYDITISYNTDPDDGISIPISRIVLNN
jgi:hypothetical protein